MARVLVALLCLMALPAVARAQATIAGVVKDTSGAVLPGVTVEASSPALIEKSRIGVTDGTGQFRIENLRPGAYTVTYSRNDLGLGAIDGAVVPVGVFVSE